jgi:hypothetical protein
LELWNKAGHLLSSRDNPIEAVGIQRRNFNSIAGIGLAMAANDVWVLPQKAGKPPDPNRNGWQPGVSSRSLRLDRSHQHDRLFAESHPGPHGMREIVP